MQDVKLYTQNAPQYEGDCEYRISSIRDDDSNKSKLFHPLRLPVRSDVKSQKNMSSILRCAPVSTCETIIRRRVFINLTNDRAAFRGAGISLPDPS